MLEPRARFGLFLFAPLAFAACGEDDDAGPTLTEAGAPASAEVETPDPFDGNPRRPGQNQDESDDSTLDSLPPPVPADPPTTTTCGSTTCRDALVGDIVVSPCCPEGEDGTCGLDLSDVDGFMPVTDQCVALDQPGNEDESCPAVYFDDPVAPQELPGCCMPEGLCGVIADLPLLADFGCVDPRELLSASGAGDDQSSGSSDASGDDGRLDDLEGPGPDASEPQSDASSLDGGLPGARDGGPPVFDAGDASGLRIAFQDVISLPTCVPAMVEEPEPAPTSTDAGGLEPSDTDGGQSPAPDTDAGGGEATTVPVLDAAAPADAG